MANSNMSAFEIAEIIRGGGGAVVRNYPRAYRSTGETMNLRLHGVELFSITIQSRENVSVLNVHTDDMWLSS